MRDRLDLALFILRLKWMRLVTEVQRRYFPTADAVLNKAHRRARRLAETALRPGVGKAVLYDPAGTFTVTVERTQ